ncbi:ABC transporter permease subunit [Streptomyces sp. NBC_00059]|uniref:ABC transporter permease subunit n=1 Tax=Streptomyces sp. NBC_00059 TaxID=2975635 RepID=UPI0022544793|nr:ABC transporter permease subunit [Streptomyces sp. NBC_00059]MCX5416736.1 ABC transporter permease [Streptomyces sp. NBC_00059]
MSTTVTGTPTTRTTRPRMLRGLTWLVLRQHRAAFGCLLALMALGSLWIVIQRGRMTDLLEAGGWPERTVPLPVVGEGYGTITTLLGLLPGIIAVFVGAPLIAADQEQGTAQLVTTQSVTRRRWLLAKLGWCYLITLVTCSVLSAVFGWWYRPYHSVLPDIWMDPSAFDTTGPVLPALALFLTAAGVTIGLLLRRVLASMVVTFFFAVATQTVWGMFRDHLAPTRTLRFPLNGEFPARLDDAYEVDRWVGSADGHLYGWGSCAEVTEKATNACVAEKGIVDNVVEFLEYDQMGRMQWTGAGILLAGTVVLTAFALWWASRRPL